MVWLSFSGLVTWWPGVRRMARGFRVRMRRGRFARDYDLHRVVGAVAVPFLLTRELTGAAFAFPGVENAWPAVTGGGAPAQDQYTFTARHAGPGARTVTPAEASAEAPARAPGEVTLVGPPADGAAYNTLSVARSWEPYAHRLCPGDAAVYVDAHETGHVEVAADGPAPLADRLYDEALEPGHLGGMVCVWWRVVWAAFGLSPLLLAVTGVPTWRVRGRAPLAPCGGHVKNDALSAAVTVYALVRAAVGTGVVIVRPGRSAGVAAGLATLGVVSGLRAVTDAAPLFAGGGRPNRRSTSRTC